MNQSLLRAGFFRVIVVPLILVSGAWVTGRGLEHQVIVAQHVLAVRGNRVVTLPSTDTVAVENDRIAFVGDLSLLPARFSQAPRVRLGTRTLMAGFVDAHSHFPVVGLTRLGADLTPSPAGTVESLSDLYAEVERAARSVPDGQWILGFNYDESGMREAQHPDRDSLDAVVSDRPVWLRHRSGHMGVGNSLALERLGVTDPEWTSPEGGRALRDGAGRLTGLLQESAAPSLARLLKEVPGLRFLSVLHRAGLDYLSAGVTTAQNGYATAGAAIGLWAGVKAGFVQPHVVVWPRATATQTWLDRAMKRLAGDSHRFSIGAYKLIADGSPQGMTALLRDPYPPSSGREPDYRGIAVLSPQQLHDRVLWHHLRGDRLAVHTNGDAAIDAALDAFDRVLQRYPVNDHRHLLVHAQTVRDDQLQRMAALGVGASFFQNHVLHWGDWHLTRSLGPARAARISPLASADAFDVDWTLHADTPVTPMQPFELMASAEQRLTRNGLVLGPEQRVDRGRALAALTYFPAWQAGLEHDRGDIREGLRADLIAISANPLDTNDIGSLTVDSVWLSGRAVDLKREH